LNGRERFFESVGGYCLAFVDVGWWPEAVASCLAFDETCGVVANVAFLSFWFGEVERFMLSSLDA
jgi:hypothetical protein